jgi:hypothetical protein
MLEQVEPQQDPTHGTHGTTPPAGGSAGLRAPLPSQAQPDSIALPSTATSNLDPLYLLLTLRKILRLNQTRMGLAVGYSTVMISHFETGRWPISQELITNLLPLFDLAQARINEDQRALDALRKLYGPKDG